MLDVILLGTGGTMPQKDRFLASCLISTQGHSVLIDCGEGTQVAMRAAAQRFKPIDAVLITHFHADHISGLAGMLLTMSNEGRREPVTIAGPVGIEKNVRALCIIAPCLPFELRFIEIDKSLCPFVINSLIVEPCMLIHSIPCVGYSLTLPHKGRFDTERARANGVPIELWSRLQKSDSAELDGKIYTSDMVLGEPRKPIKLGYFTDTRPVADIVRLSRDSSLMICEGMYSDESKLKSAVKKGHMLFCEAAALAKDAGAGELWLTHYSPSLKDPEGCIDSAKQIFKNTVCGYDGMKKTLKYE